ncbi:substrate-binding domain-containing protein [Paenibacillus sp. GCM10027626]|uniref:substrate-binding domain-containing protein n=1 Tax=Paenibacillus sp. GCM10027626 TaxID=3273411 RepID=UPI0036345B2B
MARENNYTVITCNTLQDPALEDEYIRAVMERQIKGLIISSIAPDKAMLGNCIKMGLNVIAIDQVIEEEHVSQIKFDYRKGGYMATRHLLEKGHTRIGYATSKLDRPSRKSIFKGYEDAMKEANLEPFVAEAKKIRGGDTTPFDIVLQPRLLERSSVGNKPAKD